MTDTARPTSLLDFRDAPEFPEPGFASGAVFRPAEHAEGYAYMAPWEDAFSGFPEHCRRNAEALHTIGVPVHLRSFGRTLFLTETPEIAALRKRLKPMLDASIGGYKALIHQFVPTEASIAQLTRHRYPLPSNELEKFLRRKVAYIVLERDRISDVSARTLDRLGQVWVSCERSREALVHSGVNEQRIKVVHMPYRLREPLLELRRRAPKQDVPRFYHIGKWEPRKAQDKLILAFMRAFEPTRAKLVVKTGKPFYPSTPGYPAGAGAAVLDALEDAAVKANGWTADNVQPSIRLALEYMDEAELTRLHSWGDCYLSLSHGEGWDMPAFDAMLAGNRVVYTPSGGPQEFLNPREHVEVPLLGRMPAHACYDWPGCKYWDYETDDAVAALRRAARERRTFEPNPSSYLLFHPESVGQRMLAHLKELG